MKLFYVTNMNLGKKTKCLSAFPRKWNSASSVPASYRAHNAAQRRASLLNSNKILSITLQETRCELSTYKKLFEECRVCMIKAKLVKSKMIQLSTALKDFVKDFDETLLLLDFDDSEWPDVKASIQSCKNFQKEMNPVFEATDENAEVSTDQKLIFDEENNPECCFNQVLQNTSSPSKTFQKEILQETANQKKHNCAQNNTDFGLDSQFEDAKIGNVAAIRKEPDFPQGNNSKILESPPQTVTITKIPRYQVLPVNLKRQKNFKAKNKTCEEWDRRKTFVLKSSNPTDKESPYIPEDVFISKNNKRKTFVKISSKDSLSNNNNKQVRHGLNVDESSNITDETFFKNKTISCQNSLANKEYTSVNSELSSTSSHLQSNMNHSKPVENEPAENSKKIEHILNDMNTSSEIKKTLPANGLNACNAGEKLESKVGVSKHSEIETDFVMNDDSPKNEESYTGLMNRTNIAPESHKSMVTSGCNLTPTDEINFSGRRCAFETTPIRRHISNTKGKKFVFDSNKGRSASKKKSSLEITQSQTHDDGPEKNTKICQSRGVNDAVCESNQNTVQLILDELVNKDNAFSVEKNPSNSKIKTGQGTFIESPCNTEGKAPTIKSRKRNPLKGKLKKTRKRNGQEKKSEEVYSDDGVISKCIEGDKFAAGKVVKFNKVNEEFDLPCRKTSENTFLVQAEIHSPPPCLNIENLNKENKALNFQDMQVAIVLDDVLKSRDIDFLNLCDKDVFVKTPLLRNIQVDAEERSDTENAKPRRRRKVNYKEPSINRKIRRC